MTVQKVSCQMDAPSWHPANQSADALRRQAIASSSSRTEYKEVDTSTEAERLMVSKEDENAWLGGGRGLLDPSDRMYLVEQTRLEQQEQNREHIERQTALQTFRSNALKVKKTTEVPKVAVASEKVTLQVEKKPVVVVKAKKREAQTNKKDVKVKKTKRNRSPAKTPAQRDGKDDQTLVQANDRRQEASKSVATALLLQDYSSSSDEE
ncbi:hypothetical protein P3T76_002550 [Phytophthora citrophthora]|uniref:Uncharacterized protein n=1 Tax=Phytophthora citrophthora TaxID=4793 RepID=A0AAD9LSG2_9STRA|nr:hypothetical protein P3T76_002550 [Phytophthora citrophthora]